MMVENTSLTMEYVVKSVDRFPFKKGYVAIFLLPCDVLEGDQADPPIRIKGGGDGAFPAGAMQMIEMNMKSLFGQKKKDEEYREVLLVVTEPDYFNLGWNFGDIIIGDFRKIKDGRNVNPFAKEK